jgi:predicted permease
MVNTFIRLNNLELNLDPRNVLTFSLDQPGSTSENPEKTVAFYDAVVESVRWLPGVEAVGSTDFLLPNNTYGLQRYRLPNEHYPTPQDARHAGVRYSNPGLFQVLKIPVLEGRAFGDDDRFRSDRLLVINETMAQALWPGDTAVGKQIVLFQGPNEEEEVPAEVIGVVANIGSPAFTGEPAKPRIYRDYHQTAFGVSRILVRTSADPLSLVAAVKQAVRTVDRDQSFRHVLTLEQYIFSFREYAEPRFYTALLGAFGGLALVLAAVGLLGVMGFSVARRSREFGLRIALGAQPRVVRRQVLGEAAKLVAAGLALGLVGALISARVLSPLLYGISPTDTLTYVCVALTLSGAALTACYLPARRATKVDPMAAMRHE